MAFRLLCLAGFSAAKSLAECRVIGDQRTILSTPGENLTIPLVENLTVRRGDKPQFVATS